MSWWDTSQFTSLASSALKSAQKRIDNVLDIKDDELGAKGSSSKGASASGKKSGSTMKKSGTGDDFWSAYLGTGSRADTDTEPLSSTSDTQVDEEKNKSAASENRKKEDLKSSGKKSAKDDDSSWAMSASGMSAGGWGTWSFSSFSFGSEPVSGESKEAETKKDTEVKKTDKKDAESKKSSQKERSKRSSRSSLTRSGSEKDMDVQKWVDSHDSGKMPDELEKEHGIEAEVLNSSSKSVVGEEICDVFPSTDQVDSHPFDLPSNVSLSEKISEQDPELISDSKIGQPVSSGVPDSLPEDSSLNKNSSKESVSQIIQDPMPKETLDLDTEVPNDGSDEQKCDSNRHIIENVPERLQQPLVIQVGESFGISEANTQEDETTQSTDLMGTTVVAKEDMNESQVVLKPDFGVPNQMETTGLWEDADLEVPADMLVSTDNLNEDVTDSGGAVDTDLREVTLLSEGTAETNADEPKEETDTHILVDSGAKLVESGETAEDECAPPSQSPKPAENAELASCDTIVENVEFPPDTQTIEETLPDDEQNAKENDPISCDIEGSSTPEEKLFSKELVNSSDSTTSSSGKLSQDMNTSRDTETDVSTETLKDGECEDSEESCDQEDAKTTVEGKMEESTISMASSVSSGSFVKCMLEEAMVEPETKHEDGESHSTSSDRSSDLVKIDSGHTSGDEIDTTTSSDIEIISTPASNGDRIDRPFDLSPLRHALSRTVRRVSPPHGQTHKRTDSNSSSSGHSKGSDLDQLSPGHECGVKGRERKTSGSDRGKLRKLLGPDAGDLDESEAENNPLQSERLLKKGTVYEEVLNEKLAETSEILEAREKKLLELNRDVVDLRESNNILRQQLQQSEEAREAEMTDLNSLTEEFTIRLSEQEKKLQAALKERDSMKKQFNTAQEESGRMAREKAKLLEEKDGQIEELLMEGEKLSKQQLQSSNAIKKLRAKEKDNDAVIKAQKQKLESQETELEHLRKVLDSRDETEATNTIAINQLSSAVKYQEKELEKYKGELEDATERNRSLQATLDNAYKEIAELNKANAARDSKAQELALNAEMQAKEEIKLTLDRQIHKAKQENTAFRHQIEDLQLSLTRMEKECGRREDILRQEISDLHMRLQEAEGRNEELSQSVSAATRPLLRQIENLQSTYGAQSRSWEKIEKNLIERLGEAQTQLAEVSERERVKNEKVMELTSRVSALESQVSNLRQEKSHLVASLEMERAKLEVLEDTKHKDGIQVEIMKQNLSRQLSELKKEKHLLEKQLEMEKMKVETEKKKIALVQDQLREKDRQTALAAKSSSPQPQRTRSSSQSSDQSNVFFPPLTQEDVMERTLMLSTSNGSKMNLYETLRQSGAANLLENLQSQLKQREGEIVQLQSEITDLERTRESMARELVNLTNKNEELEEKTQEFETLSNNYRDLDKRYDALLQMYGEKEEEVQELKLDLRDVKELYKTQIQELLASR